MGLLFLISLLKIRGAFFKTTSPPSPLTTSPPPTPPHDERPIKLNSWEIITPTVKVLAYVYHPASGSNPGFGDLKFPKDVLVSYTHVLLCTHNPFH